MTRISLPDWLIILLCGTGVTLSATCFAALAEGYRQLEEMRRQLSMDDQPLELNVDAGDLTGVAPPEVALSAEATLIFLHSSCGTCRLVADTFVRSIPTGVWFVIPEHDVGRLKSFEDLERQGHVIRDNVEHGIAAALRLDVTPSIVQLSMGTVEKAFGVSTVSQITRLVNLLGASKNNLATGTPRSVG